MSLTEFRKEIYPNKYIVFGADFIESDGRWMDSVRKGIVSVPCQESESMRKYEWWLRPVNTAADESTTADESTAADDILLVIWW